MEMNWLEGEITMSTQVFQEQYVGTTRQSHGFSWLQKWMLLQFHPRNIFIDAASGLWFVYFLWNHNWPAALVSWIAFSTLGLISVRGANLASMADTTLGKIGLLHSHPLNLTIQLIGLVPLIYGIWTHSAETILIGISVVLVGHVFGWASVDRRFALK